MLRLAVLLICFVIVHGKTSIHSVVKPSVTVTKSTNSSTHIKTSIASTIKTVAHSMTASHNGPNTTAHGMSSTVKPSNTSTHAASSSVHPTTKPTTKPTRKPTTKPPTFGRYDLTEKNGKFCLLTEMKVVLDVTYKYKAGKGGNHTKAPTNKTTIVMPVRNGTFSVTGNCGMPKSSLKVSWPVKNPLYMFSMEFILSQSAFAYSASRNSSWMVSMVTMDIITTNNPDFIHPKGNLSFVGNETGHRVGAKDGQVYSCGVLDFKFSDKKSKDGSLKLSIRSAKFQPFANTNSSTFSKDVSYCPTPAPEPTPSPSNSDIVPIAVGCALAGLVLIVLIAYIIGRRKSQRGYEKV